MADPITAGFAAAISGAAAIFSYNKDAFVFEKTLQQTEAHQRQAMKVQEVALYREDIRDLFGLTTQKMDNYLIVNTLMLGFCISLLYGVDLPLSTPDWIYWMWTLSMCGAMLFLLLSIWLCLHASITAQSLVVRLLTQWLRLPVPDAKEIGRFAAKFHDYEKSANMLLRVPQFAQAKDPNPTSSVGAVDHVVITGLGSVPAGDLLQGVEDLTGPNLQKTHLHLFRQLARSWRGYDAYARVCMIMGTNQLLQALGHLSIAKTFLVNQQLFASLFIVITMHSLSLIHFKLNINPTRRQHSILTFLLGVPPITAFVAASLWFYGLRTAADVVAIFAIFIHLIWICFVLTLAMEDDGGMPKNFTQVGLSTDIVGDDTFADYIDDELERMKEETVNHNAETEFSGNKKIESVNRIKRRFHKLMRQWKNVHDGTLVLTPGEERRRKRKIVHRFNRLEMYVAAIPMDSGSDISDELKVLLDAKWNRVNTNFFIHVDTGEVRVPIEEADPMKTQSLVQQSAAERFVAAVRRFKSIDTEHDYAQDENIEETYSSSSGDDTSDSDELPNTTDPLISQAKSEGQRTVRSSASTGSLIFGDSQKTNKMLHKASTRPWSAYKQGSGLLIICWLIALITSMLLPFDISLRQPSWAQSVGMAGRSDTGYAVDNAVEAAHLGIRMMNHR